MNAFTNPAAARSPNNGVGLGMSDGNSLTTHFMISFCPARSSQIIVVTYKVARSPNLDVFYSVGYFCLLKTLQRNSIKMWPSKSHYSRVLALSFGKRIDPEHFV
jgi:hypothetical protein